MATAAVRQDAASQLARGSSLHSASSSLSTTFDPNPALKSPSPLASPISLNHAVRPDPAYVATNAASQLATEAQRLRLEGVTSTTNDAQPEVENAQFTDAALVVINSFLDHLLYTFLATARASSLKAIRPAVEQVLKGKLARQAVLSAEEELEDLLADGDDEELVRYQDDETDAASWTLDAVFRRTRLRIMVYMRLGEMEDEDEERYMAEENFGKPDEEGMDDNVGLVSWAAAIFLTSVLEYMAEQCVCVASQAAYDRISARKIAKFSGVESSLTATIPPVNIEEHDVERIALSSMLGRMWRTWRKGVRAPKRRAGSSSKFHVEGLRTPNTPSQISPAGLRTIESNHLPGLHGADEIAPAGVEMPGMPTLQSDGTRQGYRPNRPRSLDLKPPMPYGLPTPEASSDVSPSHLSATEERSWRRRSRSMPVNIFPAPVTDSQMTTPRAASTAEHNIPAEVTSVLTTPGDRTGVVVDAPASVGELQHAVEQQAKRDAAASASTASAAADPLRMHPVAGSTPADIAATRDVPSASTSASRKLRSGDSAFKHMSDLSEAGTVFEEEDTMSQGTVPGGSGRQSVADERSSRNVATAFTERPRRNTKESSTAVHDSRNSNDASTAPPKPKRRSLNGSDVIEYYENSHRHAAATEKTAAQTKTTADKPTPPITRTSGPISQEARRAGNNSGTQRSSTSSGSQSSARAENLEKEFGELIASNQTVRYTLTPANLRNIEERDPSPLKTPRSPVRLTSDTPSERGSMSSGLRTVVPAAPAPASPVQSNTSKLSWSKMFVARPPTSNVKPLGSKSFVPREPRVQTASTREFAELFRTTDPNNFLGGPSISNGTSAPALRSTKSLEGGRSFSPKIDTDIPPVPRPASKGSKPMFLPRDPIIRGRDTDGLLDFLRSDPPGASVPKASSASPSATESADALTIGSYPSTNRTSQATVQSQQASINSRTGLINSISGNAVAPQRTSSAQQSPTFSGDQPMLDARGPARKQRRFRDPYAIDSDEEDMDTIKELPKEESLADFLRNTDPPSAPQVNAKPFASNLRSSTAPSSSHGSARGSPFTSAGVPEFGRFSSETHDGLKLGDSLRYGDDDHYDTAPAPQVEKYGRNRLARSSSKRGKGILRRIGVGG